MGSYPNAVLAKARKVRREAAELLADGVDPKQHREKQKTEQLQKHRQTLRAVYEMWLKVWSVGKNETTINKAIRLLERNIFPKLADYPITDINAPLVIKALRPLEKIGKLKTLSKSRTKLSQVMEFAVNSGIIDHNPIAKISAAFIPPESKNQPALPPAKLPEFMYFPIQ